MNNDGKAGRILIREHAMSNILVDGQLHDVTGKKVRDRAARLSQQDKEETDRGMNSFFLKFTLSTESIFDISNLGIDCGSYNRFMCITFIPPSSPIPTASVNNFLTTIRNPPVDHEMFSVLPVTSSSAIYSINSFLDLPTMTRGSPLKFCNKSPEAQFITSFPPGRVIWHTNGSIIVSSNGILVSARCSKSIPDRIGSELLATYKQMEQHQPFLVRGKQVANVCADFVVTGLKEDQNTKLKMSHAPKNECSAFLELEMRSKLRGLFMKHIYLTIKSEFGWFFEPVNHWLRCSKVDLYGDFVTGVTAGRLF
jgi:hypothetical protein